MALRRRTSTEGRDERGSGSHRRRFRLLTVPIRERETRPRHNRLTLGRLMLLVGLPVLLLSFCSCQRTRHYDCAWCPSKKDIHTQYVGTVPIRRHTEYIYRNKSEQNRAHHWVYRRLTSTWLLTGDTAYEVSEDPSSPRPGRSPSSSSWFW